MADCINVGETFTVEVVHIYAACENTDKTEGKGEWIAKTYHATEEDATIAADGIGPMGNPGIINVVLALKTEADGCLILQQEKVISLTSISRMRADLRSKVLDGLSAAERAALGVD